MLHTLMEMKLFVYSMVGVGVFTALVMLIINKVSAKNVQDKESYQKVTQKFKNTSLVGAIIVIGLTAVNTFGTFKLNYSPTTRYVQMLIGLGVVVALVCVEKLQEFTAKQSFINDFVFANMEEILEARNRDKPVVTRGLAALDKPLDLDSLEEKGTAERESVESLNQGIKETAVSNVGSNSKYGKYLSPEEEEIMRDVIRQYMS